MKKETSNFILLKNKYEFFDFYFDIETTASAPIKEMDGRVGIDVF